MATESGATARPVRSWPVPLSVSSDASLADELIALGRAEGLDAVGIAPALPFERARHAIDERRAAGFDAGMAFTFKNPARSTTPARAVANAQAIVVGARRYAQGALDEALPPASGRIARYARADHYAPLRAALWVLARRLRADGHRAVVFADDNSLVDREAAYLAGLGWYGKSSNLLLPGQGSWFVLGSVVTDAALPTAKEPMADGCGPCRRCLDGCPTGAIVAPGVVDARRCLAWLVQRPGSFPVEHRVALHDRLYGCDDCQEVCPPNRRGDAPSDPSVAGTDLLWLLSASDDEVLARHGRWYIAERDPRWLRRNALVALGNTAPVDDEGVVTAIDRWRQGGDPMLAEHATWALARLAERTALAATGR